MRMRTLCVLLMTGCLSLSQVALGAQLSRSEAIALYASDASALLAGEAPALPGFASSDDSLASLVTNAISGIVASGAAQVDVAALDGHVVLTGVAANAEVATQLMDTASAVEGVKEVQSRIKLSAS